MSLHAVGREAASKSLHFKFWKLSRRLILSHARYGCLTKPIDWAEAGGTEPVPSSPDAEGDGSVTT